MDRSKVVIDWNSTGFAAPQAPMMGMQQQMGTQPMAPATGYGPPPGMQRQAPTLQSRIRPVVGEMGGGAGRGAMNGNNNRSNLTTEILDLGRR